MRLASRHYRPRSQRFGRQKGHTELYRGAGCGRFPAKSQSEVVIDEAMTERVVDAIQQAAQAGRIGDSKIFISTIDEAIRIRTGERGTDAVYYLNNIEINALQQQLTEGYPHVRRKKL